MSNDESTTTILRELRALGDSDARDERFQAELAELLLARGAEARPPAVPATRGPRNRRRRLWPLVAPAGGVAATVLAVSFLLAGQDGASANALLRRVARATFQPNQALHLTYNVTMRLSGRVTHGTAEIWIATDRAGKPIQATETLRLAKFSSTPPQVVERDQQTPLGIYTYDGTHNAIVIPSRNDPGWSSRETATLPLPVYLFDGTTVAQRLLDLTAQGAASTHLLSSRTINGVLVDTVQVTGWPNGSAAGTTLYFDRDTHQLRGFDSHGTDPSYNSATWLVRLAQQTTTPRPSAPTDAFALDAPAAAVVSPPPPNMAALMRLCRSQPKPLLTGGENLLDACHLRNPTARYNQLLTALVGSAHRDLAAAVRANAVTKVQADTALQAQRAQITGLLSAAHPVLKPPAAAGKS